MMRSLSLLTWTASLLTSVAAEQPSAPKPVAAPMRDLPWGQLNFMQTTDTHGWHAGHLQEAQYSADWGDYISFAERMRKKADDMGVDVLLVDTGDRVEGNGLYDSTIPKGKYLYDIVKEQNIDILCTGNHELYQADAADREYNQTVPNFKGNYLASNLDYIKPQTGKEIPMAPRFRKFTTKNQKLQVLAFGFLFDFTGNANNTVVQPVEETIKEKWFQDAIREDVDVFVVIGHVTLDGPEFKAIFKAIRTQNWDTPIQFFGGHSHIRNYVKYDSKSYGVQAGRYMETIGWMSINNIKRKGKKEESIDPAARISFQRRYIDNNLFGYYYHTGLNETTFSTDHGKNVTKQIRLARKAEDLDKLYGCAPKDLWLNRALYPSNDSLVSWLETEVVPAVAVREERKNVPRLVMVNTGAMRFDIFKGPFVRDTTYIVSPFLSKFLYIRDVPYQSANKVLKILNSGGQIFEGLSQSVTTLAPPEQLSIKSAIIPPTVPPTSSDEIDSQRPVFSSSSDLDGSKQTHLIPGYTTKDAAGTDGDDTLHAPIAFYPVPSVFQSSISFPENGDPETVDLVFIDFIQPWVLVALRFAGQIYSETDVEVYRDETFTDLMVDWISKNWKHDCQEGTEERKGREDL